MTVAVAYDPPTTMEDERICLSCASAWWLWGPPKPHYFVIQNARSGKYHSSNDWGMTDCGKDATGPGWWWPL